MKFKFIWIDDSGDCEGTNDEKLANSIAMHERVINVETGQYLWLWQEKKEDQLTDIPAVKYPKDWS
jgi:hypothetical protein